MRFFNFSFSFCLCFIVIVGGCFGQLVVNSQPATQLANNLAGNGITVFNAVFTVGDSTMFGYFTGNTNLGLASGIVLATNPASTMTGPNSSTGSAVGMQLPGDPDLDSLASDSTFDAAVLEFDLIPDDSIFSFRYVFASEEYPEYVCSIYNDAFAFFISGPGITGKINLALVPGTTYPVTINSINIGTVGSNGSISTPGCLLFNSSYYIDNTGGTTLQSDGLTTPLTAIVNVIPQQTYHLKIAIGDVADGGHDSGVFLEESSLQTSTSMAEAVLNSDDVQVFPNPVTNELSLTGLPPGLKFNVTVFDVLGKNIISASQRGNDKLNVSSLAPGLYYLHVDYGKLFTNRCFIKQY